MNSGTGHIEFGERFLTQDQEDIFPAKSHNKNTLTNVSKSDRDKLRNKFFELE